MLGDILLEGNKGNQPNRKEVVCTDPMLRDVRVTDRLLHVTNICNKFGLPVG